MRRRTVAAKLPATLEGLGAVMDDAIKALWLENGEGTTNDNSHQFQCFRLTPCHGYLLHQVVPRHGVATFGAAVFGTEKKPKRQAMYNILFAHELRLRER